MMASHPNEMPRPAPEAILEQLEKVLSSQLFKGSERSSKLLRFLVEETVGGQQDGLKEYTVGTKALGKGHSFDPRTDPTVRSEASRLRTRLDKYYATEGLADSVVIVLPKGRYVPRFESRTTPPSGTSSVAEERPRPALGLRIPLVVLASTVIVAIALILYWQIVLRATLPGVVAQRAAAVAPASAVSIAVLPFLNLSGDATQEFFSDGMSEEITSALAKVPDLKVVARTSAFQFKSQNRDIESIGRQLHATHLIEGSVRKEGNRVRITAQLIEVGKGTHLWSENYDRQLSDIFTTQEEIARTIVGSLMAPLGLAPGESLVSNRTIDPESYEQYLRAKALVRGLTRRGIADAIGILEPLVVRNPDYAPGWALLAQAYRRTRNAGFGFRDDPKAEAAARRAIALDPDLADGYLALSAVEVGRRKLPLAEELFSKALALDPNNPDVLNQYSTLLVRVGHLKESLAMRQQLRALEPFVPGYNGNVADALWLNGQDEAAIEILKELPAGLTAGGTPGGRGEIARIYAAQGRYSEAADLLLELSSMNIPPEMAAITKDAARLLRAAPSVVTSPQDLPRLGAGAEFVYLYIGAPGRALEYYEEQGEAGVFPTALLWHPSYAPVRKMERFKTFVRKAGFVDYWRAKGWPDLCHPVAADDFACN